MTSANVWWTPDRKATPMEQIAQRRNRPVGTIKSWVRRGSLALKECLT